MKYGVHPNHFPDDAFAVLEAYGFGEREIDFSGVSIEDVVALIDFMRARKLGVTPLGIRCDLEGKSALQT